MSENLLSKRMQDIVDKTSMMGVEYGIEYFPIELVLKNILDTEPEVSDFLSENNCNIEKIKKELDKEIKKYVKENKVDSVKNCKASVFFQSSISRSMVEIKISDKKIATEVDVFHIFASSLLLDTSKVSEILHDNGLRREMFVDILEKEIENDDNQSYEENYSEEEMQGQDGEKMPNPLINLTEKARKGEFKDIIGRTDELKRISTILARKNKNNPIIIGESGVGKTALVEGLAYKISKNLVDDSLKGQEIYQLDLTTLLSGTKYRGDFEQRVKSLIHRIEKENCILFIDDIHTILGAGSTGGAPDMSEFLKPALTNGRFKVIGATSSKDYQETFEKKTSLARRFNEVIVKEMTKEETLNLLKGVESEYKSHHKVSYQEGLFEDIIKLCDRYITKNHFPDKALDILDEVSATVRLNSDDKVVKHEDLVKLIAKTVNVPIDSMEDNSTNKAILKLADKIKEGVFGQDSAVEKVSNAMKLSFAGVKRKNKPMGSFLCVGPTGVGKTELAKQLAQNLNMTLARFDMSEYTDVMGVKKLLGAEAGYVGYQEGGLLLKKLKDNPYSVVLFDEFEKAHPEIKNIFLQILDEGYISDAQGRLVDFKNTIILFTSNAGVMVHNQERNGIGFNTAHKKAGVNMEVINQQFPPEFRNRLTGVVEFNSLTKESTTMIAHKSIQDIANQLSETRGIVLTWSEDVARFIGEEGFDEAMGARPIEREVEKSISLHLSDIILEKELGNKDKVSLTLSKPKKDEDKPTIKFTTRKAK